MEATQQTAVSPVAGVKRRNSSTYDLPVKKQRVRHKLHHTQPQHPRVELASQDAVPVQGQLLRSIAAGLVIAGFDSVKESAMEMFRGQVEEYMLKVLTSARASMQTSRRTKPTASDFAWALAKTPNTSTASMLKPQLSLNVPPGISHPSVSTPCLEAPPAPELSSLLQPLMSKGPRAYIPKHFPTLPPEHTWKSSGVFPPRENDARKMREKATQEGMLAEQALRKLAAAEKAGKEKLERKRAEIPMLPNKAIAMKKKSRVRIRPNENTLDDLMREVDEDG